MSCRCLFNFDRREIISPVLCGSGNCGHSSVLICRYGSKVKIKNIVLKINGGFEDDNIDFFEELKEGKIILEVGGVPICTLLLCIILPLSTIINSNNLLIINIPDYFLQEINLEKLERHEVRVFVEHNSKKLCFIKLNCDFLVCGIETETEKKIKDEKIEDEENIFQSMECYDNFYDYHIPNGGCVKFMLQCERKVKGIIIGGNINIEDIEKIEISIGRNLFIDYEEDVVMGFCEIIDENTFYIPFNTNKSFSSNTLNSFEYCLDCKEKFVVNIKIKEKDENEEDKIIRCNIKPYVCCLVQKSIDYDK